MTHLTKPFKRSVSVPGLRMPMTIIIDPETKTFGFREYGGHKVYTLPIMTAYRAAIDTFKVKKGKKK